jgi:hypothetical protein
VLAHEWCIYVRAEGSATGVVSHDYGKVSGIRGLHKDSALASS